MDTLEDIKRKRKLLEAIEDTEAIIYAERPESGKPRRVVGGGLSSESLGESYPYGDKRTFYEKVMIPAYESIGLGDPDKYSEEVLESLSKDNKRDMDSSHWIIESDPDRKQRELIRELQGKSSKKKRVM